MGIAKEFITTVVELSAFMILWKKFRLKEEKTFLKDIIIILISSFVVAVTSNMKVYYNMIFSFSAYVSLVSYFYRKKFTAAFLEFCLFLTAIMILQLISMFTLNILSLNKYLEPFLFNLCANFIVLIIVIGIYYLVPDKINIARIDSRVVYYFIINLAIYIAAFKIIWNYDKNIILHNIVVIISIHAGLFVLNLILYYYIIKINEEKKAMLIQNTYNPIINNIIEEVKSKQHDFKNHLNTINGLVELTDEKEVKACVKDYIKSLNYSTKSMEDILYINNPILGAIIYNKLCKAENTNIDFLYFVDNNLKELNINDYELSEVLNNLLDNAFEAVDNNNREVILRITNEGGKNIIEVRNQGTTIKPENISKIFKRGFSTKEGKNRGYGLHNVKKIVEHIGGEIQLFFEGNYTIFKVLI